MTSLTIAVAKGYLFSESLSCFEKCGITFPDSLDNSRRLFMMDSKNQVRLLQIRPWDVPAYVALGAADIGIVGQDVLYEQDPDLIRLVDLKFGRCQLVIAGPHPGTPDSFRQHLKVATKYPKSTELYFRNLGIKAHLLKLYGAIELAPLTGLSDLICDLTATGKTLIEHGLSIIDTLHTSSACLVANKSSLYFHRTQIYDLCDRLQKIV